MFEGISYLLVEELINWNVLMVVGCSKLVIVD